MRTDHVEELLPDFIQHQLDETAALEVERHLAVCRRCRAEMGLVQDAFELIKNHPPLEPSAAYFNGFLPRLRARLERRQEGWLAVPDPVKRIVFPLAAAAVVVILLLHIRIPVGEKVHAQNPLRPLLEGVDSDELIGIVVDQANQQPILPLVDEAETNLILAGSLLRNGNLLEGPEASGGESGFIDAEELPEILEQLSDSDLEAFIARLGERTTL